MSQWIGAPVFSFGQVLALCLNYLLEMVFPTPYIALDYPSQITHQVFLAFIAISIYVHRETFAMTNFNPNNKTVAIIQQVTNNIWSSLKPSQVHERFMRVEFN